LAARSLKPVSGLKSGYFFILVKAICNDHRSRFDFLLILLANRFNSAYYLVLNTGNHSGIETSKQEKVVGCGWNAQNCRAPEVHAAV